MNIQIKTSKPLAEDNAQAIAKCFEAYRWDERNAEEKAEIFLRFCKLYAEIIRVVWGMTYLNVDGYIADYIKS